MISSKDTTNIPKIVFPLVSNKYQLRKILNINQWDKLNESLLYKLELATEIFFNRYIFYHLRDATFHRDKIFRNACRYKNMEIAQLMMDIIENSLSILSPEKRDEKGVDYWNFGLSSACEGGHVSIVNLMIKKGANDWNFGLFNACEGGHLSIVNLMIDKGANYWNAGLFNACKGGHISIVNLMIAKGANDWNSGLDSACYGGHMSTVNLMIDKGANRWNNGLDSACRGGHMSTVNLMIDKGANNLNRALEIASNNKNLEITNYLSKLLKIEN